MKLKITMSSIVVNHSFHNGVSTMKLTHVITLMASVGVLISGCAGNTSFPPEIMDKVSPTFQFEAWRDAGPSNEAGKSDAGIKVELGGRIVQATKNGKGMVIVAQHLPIVNSPVYGPAEDAKRTGDHEFAFLYEGGLESLDLMKGNRFIIVGTTTGRRPVLVNGIPKTEPFIIADCIHVWQTGGAEIAEFKEDVGGGYSSLPEKTYCVAKK
jgi:starvation-inducible outer membrane lipoprotein